MSCSPRLVQSHSLRQASWPSQVPWQQAMAKPAHHHSSRPPSYPTLHGSSSSHRCRRPQRVTAPSAATLFVLASLAGANLASALPTEHDLPDFLCPVLVASRGSDDRGSEIDRAQDKPKSQPTSPSCSETTTSVSSAQAPPLQPTSTSSLSAEAWLIPQDNSLPENSISPRYRRLTQRRAKRANTNRQVRDRGQRARKQYKRQLADLYERNIPDRYELGEDGLWHKVEFYASCSRCQVRVTCTWLVTVPSIFLFCSWTIAIHLVFFASSLLDTKSSRFSLSRVV